MHLFLYVLGSLERPNGVFLGSFGVLGHHGRTAGAQERLICAGKAPLDGFWHPKGAQEGADMELKSVKSRFKHRLNFLLGFVLVLHGFLMDFDDVFGTLDLRKWAFGVSEVLLFNKSSFFHQIWFGSVFLMILGGFWKHFGSQNNAKIN